GRRRGRPAPGGGGLAGAGPGLPLCAPPPPVAAPPPPAAGGAGANPVVSPGGGRPPVGPQDLAALPEDLRAVVAACLAPDPAARPVARTVLARLLRGHDLSSGLLAEGTRQARAAARVPASAAHVTGQPAPIRSRAGVIICAVCVIAIVVAAVFVFRPRPRPGAPTSTTPQVSTTRLPRPLPSASAPAALAGSWAGPIHQTNPQLTVSVRISLPASSATG